MTADDLVRAAGNRRKTKPKPPPEPRAALLRRLLADIEEHDHHAHRPALFERLQADEGLKVEQDEARIDVTVRLAGLIGHSISGRSAALQNWCRAARQDLLALTEAPEE